MINHARTLLVNFPGEDVPTAGSAPGDEYVPPFRPLPPGRFEPVRRALLGDPSDRAGVNYRAHRLLSLAAATPLAGHVTALDPRVTYPRADHWSGAFSPSLSRLPADSGTRDVVFQRADAAGRRVGFAYRLRTDGGNTLTATLDGVDRSTPLTFSSGLSQKVVLAGSGVGVRVTQGVGVLDAEAVFCLRPADTLADALAAVAALGEPALLALFGTSDAEPYASFGRLWRSAADAPLRAAAAALALVYRLEAERTSGG